MPHDIRSFEERFWDKVQKTKSCWLWTGHRNRNGYGCGIRNHYKRILAHRASWIINCGEIPNGKLVLHKCDNPPCVNPEHLFIGTYRDNNIDMYKKGRGTQGAKQGSKNINSKLTEEDVKFIKNNWQKSNRWNKPQNSIDNLAKRFNVSKHTIRNIIYNNSWNHV